VGELRTEYSTNFQPAEPISPSKPQPTLVGKWRTPSGGQFEFRADGTVIRTLPFATLEDKYQVLDDGTLEIQETQGGARKRIRFAFRTPDEVTFTYPDGPPVGLSRVK